MHYPLSGAEAMPMPTDYRSLGTEISKKPAFDNGQAQSAICTESRVYRVGRPTARDCRPTMENRRWSVMVWAYTENGLSFLWPPCPDRVSPGAELPPPTFLLVTVPCTMYLHTAQLILQAITILP